VSSADGWLAFGDEPQAGARVMPRKRRPKAGEGRAYTQNPATAQAKARARRSRFGECYVADGALVRNPEAAAEGAGTKRTKAASCA